MKRITLEQLKALYRGAFICRSREDGTPYGGIYIWCNAYPDNNLFGYAEALVKNGYNQNWEEGLSGLPSRFYYHDGAGMGSTEGTDETFYLFTPDDLTHISYSANAAIVLFHSQGSSTPPQ